MSTDDRIREQIAPLLSWEAAHVGFDTVVDGIPPEKRGATPPGLPYSPWQLLEHLRLSQFDILEFCRNSNYKEQKWPDDYWPKSPAPPSAAAWTESIEAFR